MNQLLYTLTGLLYHLPLSADNYGRIYRFRQWLQGYRWHNDLWCCSTYAAARQDAYEWEQIGFFPGNVRVVLTDKNRFRVQVWCTDRQWDDVNTPF